MKVLDTGFEKRRAAANAAALLFIIHLNSEKPRSTAPPRILDVFFIPSVSVIHRIINATKMQIISVSFFIILPPARNYNLIIYHKKNKSSRVKYFVVKKD